MHNSKYQCHAVNSKHKQSQTVNNEHISIFTCHLFTTDRNIFRQVLNDTVSTKSEHSLLDYNYIWLIVIIHNTWRGTHLYSAGTQRRNLQKSLVTTSRATCFILRSNTGTCLSHTQRQKSGESIWNKWSWMHGNVEMRNSWQWAKHARLHSDLLRALQGNPLTTRGPQQSWPEFLRPQYPTAGVILVKGSRENVGMREDPDPRKLPHDTSREVPERDC